MKDEKLIVNLMQSKVFVYTLMFWVFISMLITNYIYPIFSDDWLYSFVWNTPKRVESLSDIISSQYVHYMTWGGRSIVHSVAQFILYLPKLAQAVLNALAYLLLTLIIYNIAINNNLQRLHNVGLYIAIFALLWLCTPALSAVTMWKTGSANYLWGTLISVYFTSYFFFYLKNETNTNTIGITTLGLIAGWCNESSSLAIIFFLGFFFFFLKTKKIKFPKWAIYGASSFLIGTIILFMAPGNYVRLNKHLHGIDEIGFLDTFTNNLELLYSSVWKHSSMYILLIGCLILFANLCRKKSTNKTNIYLSILSFLVGVVAILAMLCSPQFPPRTLFFPVVLFLISFSFLYNDINLKNKWILKLNLLFLVCLISIYAWDYNGRRKAIINIAKIWEERNEFVRKEKEAGNLDVIILERYPAYLPAFNPHKYHVYDLSTDTAAWYNKAYSKYHEINSVRISEP